MNIETFNQIHTNYKELYTDAATQSIALSEEDVKNAFITPLIKEGHGFKSGLAALHKVGTFATEVEVQVGHSTVVYPDYMLYCMNNKAVVVEAKAPSETIDDNIGQLETAVNASASTMGILCNGLEFAVFLKDNNGNMETTPCKRISLLNPSDEDRQFIVSIFDPKYTVNDAQIRRELEFRKKQALENEKSEKTTNGLIELALNPIDESWKTVIRKVENISVVSAQKLQEYKEKFGALYNAKLKETLVGDALYNYKKDESQKNHLFPEEYACGKIAELILANNNCDAVFKDDEEHADRSFLLRSDNKRTLVWFLGETTDTGYVFKGIAFPNRTKGRGKLIPISDPKELSTVYGTILQGVYDNISSDTWCEFYDTTLASLN